MATTHQDKVMAGLRRYWATQQVSPDLLDQLRVLPRAVVRVRAPEPFAAVSVTAAMIAQARRAGREWFGWIGDLRSQVIAAGAAGLSRSVAIHVARPDREEIGAVADCDHIVIDTFRGGLGTDPRVQARVLAMVRAARCVYVMVQGGQATAEGAPLRAEFASYPVVECRLLGGSLDAEGLWGPPTGE